jgi:hypothetical protein
MAALIDSQVRNARETSIFFEESNQNGQSEADSKAVEASSVLSPESQSQGSLEGHFFHGPPRSSSPLPNGISNLSRLPSYRRHQPSQRAGSESIYRGTNSFPQFMSERQESLGFDPSIRDLVSLSGRVLQHQLLVCEERISELIENSNVDETETASNEAQIEAIYARTNEINNNRELIRRFENNFDEAKRDRDALRRLFTITRHAFEYHLSHPDSLHRGRRMRDREFDTSQTRIHQRPERPRGLERRPGGDPVENPLRVLGEEPERTMDHGGGLASLFASMMGLADGNLRVERFELGGNNGNNGNDQRGLREMLQRMGAPSSFWENIPVPMTDQNLERMPSKTYEEVEKERGENCNKECNVCLETFEQNDMVRVFPCCHLAQHTSCLDRWFETHDNCIVCRTKMSDIFK